MYCLDLGQKVCTACTVVHCWACLRHRSSVHLVFRLNQLDERTSTLPPSSIMRVYFLSHQQIRRKYTLNLYKCSSAFGSITLMRTRCLRGEGMMKYCKSINQHIDTSKRYIIRTLHYMIGTLKFISTCVCFDTYNVQQRVGSPIVEIRCRRGSPNLLPLCRDKHTKT